MLHTRCVSTILVAAIGLGCSAGCRRTTAAASRPLPGGSPAADSVVAEVAGQRITLAEVDKRAAGRLQRLADEQYEIRRGALDEIVNERLLDREASRRGVSRDALVKAEITDKVEAPAAAQVRAIYDRSRERLGGQSFEQLRPHIERSLAEQARAQRESAFQQELRSQATVRIALAPPKTTVPIPADAPTRGPASAPVTIVEFLDYQCPYCHRAEEVVEQVLDRYREKVRFVHRDFLLGRPRSLPAARAARCAGEQQRFWEYHRSLLTEPGDMSDEDLQRRARSSGLDLGRFGACLSSDRHDASIRQAVADGQQLGITGTPTFFVNGRRLVGVRTLEQFQELIDSELAGG